LARKVIAIQELEALGAHVHMPSVDVADESQLQAFLDEYSLENHPPIRGIVHAAGIMQYQSLLEHDLESMQAIMRPKIIGSWLLHQSLGDASLDFFVSFSSAASILNSPLTGSYAAANAYLDALAHYQKARGLQALSINWGLWTEVGMAEQIESREANASYRAIAPIDPQQGVEALEILLGRGSTQVGVMPINWELWKQLYPAFSQSRMLSHITGTQADAFEGSDELKLTPEMVISLEPLERQARLEAYLGEQAAMVLGLSNPTIDVRKPLTSLGFDSLMAIELKNRIENDLRVVIPMVEFLQGPGVTQLASSVLDKLATEGTTQGAAPGAGADGPAQELQESEWEGGLI
jgi:short-subunit dehydrogenase/acyl carrier protein